MEERSGTHVVAPPPSPSRKPADFTPQNRLKDTLARSSTPEEGRGATPPSPVSAAAPTYSPVPAQQAGKLFCGRGPQFQASPPPPGARACLGLPFGARSAFQAPHANTAAKSLGEK